jgi:penicillin-binding protein 2
MEGCVTHGTAGATFKLPEYQIPGVRIVGKTGTAQLPKKLNMAWFMCFAPREKPEIAVVVAIQSDTPGEEFGGGRHSAPIAALIMKKYFEKKAAAKSAAVLTPTKSTTASGPVVVPVATAKPSTAPVR